MSASMSWCVINGNGGAHVCGENGVGSGLLLHAVGGGVVVRGVAFLAGQMGENNARV